MTTRALLGWDQSTLNAVLEANPPPGGLWSLLGGLPLAGLGGLLVLSALVPGGPGPMGAVCGMPPGALGALLVGSFVLGTATGPAFYRVLSQRRSSVVWAYQEVNRFSTSGCTTVVLALVDGTRVTFEVPKTVLGDVLRTLQATLPGAVLGYSGTIDQAFRANPRALPRPMPAAAPAASSPPPEPWRSVLGRQHRLLRDDATVESVAAALEAAGWRRSSIAEALRSATFDMWERPSSSKITFEVHDGMRRLIIQDTAPSDLPALPTLDPEAIELSPTLPAEVLQAQLRRLEWLAPPAQRWAGIPGSIPRVCPPSSPYLGPSLVYDPPPSIVSRLTALAASGEPTVATRAAALLAAWR